LQPFYEYDYLKALTDPPLSPPIPPTLSINSLIQTPCAQQCKAQLKPGHTSAQA